MVKLKPAGVVGKAAIGLKEDANRVDFDVDRFNLQVETKGYRLAWSRAMLCPCVSVNTQTEQSDPNCPLCQQHPGMLLFKPSGGSIVQKVVGDLDAVQLAVIGTDATVIKGLMTGFSAKMNLYDQVLRRLDGMTTVTVRPENRLGYHDRLVVLDTSIVYTQVAKATGGATLKTRYPVIGVNLMRTISTVFVLGTHFNIVAGVITWIGTPPSSGTIVGVHYLTFPHWKVVDLPNFTRNSLVRFKKKKLETPEGDPTDMPVRATLKNEFLT